MTCDTSDGYLVNTLGPPCDARVQWSTRRLHAAQRVTEGGVSTMSYGQLGFLFRVWPGQSFNNKIKQGANWFWLLICVVFFVCLFLKILTKLVHANGPPDTTYTQYCYRFTTGHFVTTPIALFLYWVVWSQAISPDFLFLCLWMWTLNLFLVDVPPRQFRLRT